MENFVNCSNLWSLDINIDKTKILFFGDRPRRDRNIIVQGQIFEVVETFKYLGVILSKNRRHVIEQARKALFSLCVKIRNLDLPIDCQLKLFDNTVAPFCCMAVKYGDLEN